MKERFEEKEDSKGKRDKSLPVPLHMLPHKYIKNISRGQRFKEKMGYRIKKIDNSFAETPSWLITTATVILLAIATLVFDGVNPENSSGIQGSIVMSLKTIFENAESIAITTAVVIYIKESSDRKKQQHYDAWQVIDRAAAGGKSTSPARFKALQDLNKDHVSLRGLDVPNSDLREIKLPGSDLCFADFQQADLNSADLSHSNLLHADFSGANLIFINLNHSHPTAAKFNHSYLRGSNLIWAVLEQAQFVGAELNGTNFTDAYLRGADFTNADLSHTIFSGADLINANLSNAILFEADLEDVINLESIQITGDNSPLLCCTKLPASIEGVSPDRDCNEVALLLDEHYNIGTERAHLSIKRAKEKRSGKTSV